MDSLQPSQISSPNHSQKLEDVKQRVQELKMEYDKKINVLLREIDTLHLEEIRKKIGI